MNAPASREPVPNTDVARIPELVQRLRATFDAGTTRPLDWRREQLSRLRAMARECGEEFVARSRRTSGSPSSRRAPPTSAR